RMQYRYQRGQTWTDWEGVATVSDLENVNADMLDGKHASAFVAKTWLTPNTYHGILEGVEINAGFVTNPEGALRIYGASMSDLLRAGDVITYGMESEGYDGVSGGTYRVVMLDARRFIISTGAFGPWMFVVLLGGSYLDGDDRVYEIGRVYRIDMEESM
ncbi:MAG: hypothetical protein K2H86_09555, partial [Muribaculaceae bacterium]|nr:hypothetical protein [Muribaculaceae bacterium]